MSPDDITAVVVGLLGGRAAEEVLGLGPSTGAHSDLGEATALVAAKHASYGLGASLARLASIDRASALLDRDRDLRAVVEAELQSAYGVAQGIVRRHQALVEGLARLLVAQRVVDETAFLRLVEAHDRAIARAEQEGPRHG
ncbi:peptidase M41-like protein [Methylobacterium sp. B4]|nr:peptidase M41-like protein [Methylobacterium sp. B4]